MIFYAQLHFKTSVNNDDQSSLLLTEDYIFYLVSLIREVQNVWMDNNRLCTPCLDDLPYPSAFHMDITDLLF